MNEKVENEDKVFMLNEYLLCRKILGKISIDYDEYGNQRIFAENYKQITNERVKNKIISIFEYLKGDLFDRKHLQTIINFANSLNFEEKNSIDNSLMYYLVIQKMKKSYTYDELNNIYKVAEEDFYMYIERGDFIFNYYSISAILEQLVRIYSSIINFRGGNKTNLLNNYLLHREILQIFWGEILSSY